MPASLIPRRAIAPSRRNLHNQAPECQAPECKTRETAISATARRATARSTGHETHAAWIAPVLAACAMSGFAVTAILAKFTYGAGANALTLLAGRHLFVPLALGAYFAVRRRRPWLPRGMRGRALLLGAVLAANSFGYIGAVRYIPVSLAVLIFYTYPLIVALMSRVFDRRPLGPRRLAALMGAFVGLVLLLGAGARSGLDPRGIGLAALAAVSLGNVMFWGDRLLGRAHADRAAADPLAVKFHMMIGAGAVIVIAFAVAGRYAPPQTSAGWGSFGGFCALYLASFVTLFSMLPRLGAVKAVLICNVEPLVTVLLAILLLGERLAPMQFLGGALVIGALLLSQLADRRKLPPPVESLD